MVLHIANGSSTTRLIEQAGIAGERSIWADPLHDGPVPGGLSDEALREVRARHLTLGLDPDEWRAAYAHLTEADGAVARARDFDEMVLWFEHDLFDQLVLIQLLDRIAGERDAGGRASLPPVSLICIDRFVGHSRFRGLGELTPSELATLWDRRMPVTADQYVLASRAWLAFRSDDPRDVERVVASDTSPLPFLHAALSRYLEEFPDVDDGLSRTERRVLELARVPTDTVSAFTQMHDGETAFFIGDLSFWNVVRELAGCDPPLISAGDPRDFGEKARSVPHVALATTPAGNRVLDREADRVPLTGIATWRGGVHLEGRGPIWRWDRRSRLLTRR